jgi:hypothetical protein
MTDFREYYNYFYIISARRQSFLATSGKDRLKPFPGKNLPNFTKIFPTLAKNKFFSYTLNSFGLSVLLKSTSQRLTVDCQYCGYRIVAIMRPCQGRETGSIPVTRSEQKQLRKGVVFFAAFLCFPPQNLV